MKDDKSLTPALRRHERPSNPSMLVVHVAHHSNYSGNEGFRMLSNSRMSLIFIGCHKGQLYSTRLRTMDLYNM